MDRHPQSTRDVIHVSLERLGYTGEVFQAVRIWSGSVAVYRNGSETVTVSGAAGSSLFEVSVSGPATVQLLCETFTAEGLTCRPAGTRIDVHGQEHIDAEVRKMLAR